MTKKKRDDRRISNDLINFLETNFSELCEKRKKDKKDWNDVIVHIIVEFDEQLHQAEIVIKQAEAILDNATAEEKNDES